LNPVVSVIIPVFRDWNRLKVCLASLAGQKASFESFEVIVVDNDPHYHEVVLPDYPMKVYLEKESIPGSYAARNKAISIARGQALLFTDSDCIPSPTWINEAIRLLEDSEFDLFAGKVQVEVKSNSWVAAFDQAFAFPIEDYVLNENFGVTANLLVRKSVFDAIGKFNAAVFTGGDSEFCNRAIRKGHKISYADNLLVIHPARESWEELKTKAIRFGGRLPQGNSKSIILLKILGKYRIRWKDLKGIWSRANLPVGHKLVFTLIRQRLRWVEATESLQVFLGKTPGRR